MINSILTELRSSTKRKFKDEVLMKNKDNETLKRLFEYTYSPEYNYYIRAFDKKYSSLLAQRTLEDTFDLLDKLNQREVTGNAAKQLVEDMYQLLSKDDADLFACILDSDLKCGASVASANKVWKGLIREEPYMRCSSFTQENLSHIKLPCYSQCKMDGLYVNIIIGDNGTVEYKSRSGETVDLNDHHFDAMLCEISPLSVMMGEVVATDEQGVLMERSLSNGYINSDDIDINRVHLFVWDVIPVGDFKSKVCEHPYKSRMDKLKSAITSDRFITVSTVECNTTEQILSHFKEMREQGQEGTVVKNFDGIWKHGTSKDQVKIKVVFDVELRITGYKEHKHTGRLGAFICKSADNHVIVSVGNGYTDKQRFDFWENRDKMIGSICTVRSNDISKTDSGYSLFLPRFVEIRADKTEADSLERIQEQLDSCVDALDMIK